MRKGSTLLLATTLLASCGTSGAGNRDTTPPPAESTETLSAGWTAPNFSLANYDGTRVDLHAEAKKGPVVLVFYRGHW